jgi:hypothetical protein
MLCQQGQADGHSAHAGSQLGQELGRSAWPECVKVFDATLKAKAIGGV